MSRRASRRCSDAIDPCGRQDADELELVYAAALPSAIALVLPAALFVVIAIAAFRQTVGARGPSRAEPLIPLLALCWFIAAASAAEGIDTVMASDNRLNVEPIFRYLRDRAASRGIRLLIVDDRELVPLRGHVPLRDLPYNEFWKRRYIERAGQPDAIDVWIVR